MAEETRIHDFCMAWVWEFDRDFAAILERQCQEAGLSFLQVQPDNLGMVHQSVLQRDLMVNVFLDRASDADLSFLPLVEEINRGDCRCINMHSLAKQAWDKNAMHRVLEKAGIPVPVSILLPSYNDQPDPGELDLCRLGRRFVVKPAHGGGSDGVVLGAASLETVQAVRREYPDDAYMLQEIVHPSTLDGKPAWFRVLVCAGSLFPFWWHPQSHIYTPLSVDDHNHFNLQILDELMHWIEGICGLDLFSSEIALREDVAAVVVDYVNDPVDLLLQSTAPDGVPDETVWKIAKCLVKQAIKT